MNAKNQGWDFVLFSPETHLPAHCCLKCQSWMWTPYWLSIEHKSVFSYKGVGRGVAGLLDKSRKGVSLLPRLKQVENSTQKIFNAEKWKWQSPSRARLCDLMDRSPPGSFVHGILQGRILEWVAILFSWRSSQRRDQSWVSSIAGRFFIVWATRGAPSPKVSDILYSTQRAHLKLCAYPSQVPRICGVPSPSFCLFS